MTTIKIKDENLVWDKTSFDNTGELLDYLLERFQVGKLKKLPKGEITEQRKKDWEEVEVMSNEDFIDIR